HRRPDRARGEAKPGSDQAAGPGLGGDDSTPVRSDEERWPDRPVADLGGYGQGAQQSGEEGAHLFTRAEQPGQLVRRGAPDVVGGQPEAVQQDGEEDEADHGSEQAEAGPGRTLLQQLGAKDSSHDAPPVSSRKTSSSVRPESVRSSSRPVAT